MDRKWYQQTWAIIALLWLFFPVGVYLMWRHASWGGRIKWAVSAGWAGLVVLVIVAAAIGGDDDVDSESVVVDQESAEQEPAKPTKPLEPTDVPQPSWEDGAPLIEESVRKVLKDADEAIRSENLGDSRTLFVDEALGSITVVYKADSALGETDLLSIGAQTSFSAMRALFANRRVQTVTVTLLADWTDQFGNSKEEQTTKSTIGRALVDSRIDWDGLEDRVYGDNKLFFCISDDYYIHPAIYVRLKDKGCLLR